MNNPNRPLALQTYLSSLKEITDIVGDRIAFLKMEVDGSCIVYNEGNRSQVEGANQSFQKGIDMFPILIDIVVKYDVYEQGLLLRGLIRKYIGKFNGALSKDREGTITREQNLAPEYNPTTEKITFGSVYLLKQNYDYEEN